MMKAAQAGKFEHLLVWKLDRLGRSLPHLLNSLDLLAGWGVRFGSVRDPGIDATSATVARGGVSSGGADPGNPRDPPAA